MAWWKDGDDFYYSTIYARIYERQGSGDSHADRRFAILWHLLRTSANGMRFTDHRHLARVLSRKHNQCQYVWDICIEEGVLRQVSDTEYNALEWMIEQGYYGEGRTENNIKPKKQKSVFNEDYQENEHMFNEFYTKDYK